MLRFPLRLAADLTRARIAKKLRGDSYAAPILLIRPMEEEDSSALDSVQITPERKTGTELLARVRKSLAPVVWIGGPEPLLHPEMGQLARCIAGHGQHVFLETDGTLLRRRIHEFRPVSRLFLTVQLNGLERSHNLRAGGGDAFQLAVEGIRAAQLSGFLICVHARIDTESNLQEVAELVRFAGSHDVDGIVISHAAQLINSADCDREALKQKTVEARKLIRNRWWESFSRLVETALNHEHGEAQSVVTAAARNVAQEANASEESVRVA
jgi:molybdenum cofactor biosynthesis enzyme MoaA